VHAASISGIPGAPDRLFKPLPLAQAATDGRTGLEPVTPSLSSRGERSPRFGQVRLGRLATRFLPRDRTGERTQANVERDHCDHGLERERVSGEFGSCHATLTPNVIGLLLSVTRDLLEEHQRIGAWSIPSDKIPDLRPIRTGLAADPGEVGEEQPRRFDRVMSCVMRDNEREVRLSDHRELTRLGQHPAVCRDQTVPRSLVVVKRDEDLPVVEFGELRVNMERDQLRRCTRQATR
jgi:hypothetical protein